MEAVQAVRKRKDSLHGMVKGPLRLHTGVPSAFAEGARSLDGGYPHIALNDSAANALHRFPENAIYTTKCALCPPRHLRRASSASSSSCCRCVCAVGCLGSLPLAVAVAVAAAVAVAL